MDQEYLDKPRRWNIRSIRNFMLFIGPISSIFDYATWFLMLYVFGCAAFGHAGTPDADKAHLEELFHSAWFVESIVTQTLIVHIIRTRRDSLHPEPGEPDDAPDDASASWRSGSGCPSRRLPTVSA